LDGPAFRLVGLTPDTEYTVRILATNAMGPGRAAQLTFRTNQGAPATADELPTIANLAKRGGSSTDEVALNWGVAAGARGYRVQFRPHDSDQDWSSTGTVGSPSTEVKLNALGRLAPEADYDVRVVPYDDNGDGPPSNIVRLTTGPRAPTWSDLVTDEFEPNEVDVARVQMLVFTVISASFVALKIAESGTIPEIPSSYVTLMGISNGVYLTAKFARRSTT
jgi:hypothetical protein